MLRDMAMAEVLSDQHSVLGFGRSVLGTVSRTGLGLLDAQPTELMQ